MTTPHDLLSSSQWRALQAVLHREPDRTTERFLRGNGFSMALDDLLADGLLTQSGPVIRLTPMGRQIAATMRRS